MQNHEEFGARLRMSRINAGWTLQRLADYLGISVPYLSEVERGRRAPLTVDRIRSAAAALNVRPEELQRAAGVSRGGFTLDAGPTPLHVDVAAELAEVWPRLTSGDLTAIREELRGGSLRRSRKAGAR